MDKPPLADPPETRRGRELWLNHAIGYLLVRDVRDYALDQLDPELSEAERHAALKGIDDAVYGLMMVLDGVPQPFKNSRHKVALEAQLVHYQDGEVVERTGDFEGFCMGYHGWVEGDFGTDPILDTPNP